MCSILETTKINIIFCSKREVPESRELSKFSTLTAKIIAQGSLL